MRVALLLLGLAAGSFACSNDTFVNPDASSTDGGGDVANPGDATADAPSITDDGGGFDASGPDATTGDGGLVTRINCSGTTCTEEICCGGLTAWGGPFCQPASAENTTLCTNWLQCDDHADCPTGQVCCATQTFNGVTSQNVLDHSYCAAGCTQLGSFQLCTQNPECGSANCKAYGGDPSWVHTCQQ